MKQVRLLPVVIVAAGALLLLKGLGIMTNGGYVLLGPSKVAAAGAAGAGPDSDSVAATMAVPDEATMTDTNPVLADTAPTLPLGPAVATEAGHDAEEATEGQAEDATAGDGSGALEAAESATDVAATEACPPVEAPTASPEAGGEEAAGFDFINGSLGCGVNQHGDALPTIKDGAGNISPLAHADGSESEKALLERLAQRREELDARESELEMRMALVQAAEKRIAERTVVLEALEARINAMVDEKRTLEEAQFVALVAMYETMKPKDAAAIFDELEMPVLLRVARAIEPRKMAPIMARMDPLVAKELTTGLAVDRVEPTIELGEQDLAALPQIIGQ